MKEIKFVAQRIDTLEWESGYLLYISGKPFIFPFGAKINHIAHWGTNGIFGILGSGDADEIIGDGKRQSDKWLCEVIPGTISIKGLEETRLSSIKSVLLLILAKDKIFDNPSSGNQDMEHEGRLAGIKKSIEQLIETI